MINLKDEFYETMEIFFDIVVLNIFFYVITFTSFSLLLLPTLFIFANSIYRYHRKKARSIFMDIKDVVKRDFYLILKHNAIQWVLFVLVVLIINNITVTVVFTAVTFPILLTFWYLFINRTLGFFEYYKVTFQILLGHPLLYLLLLVSSIIASYVIFFLNGFYLIVFAPMGLVYLQLFAVDKIVLKLEGKNAKSEN